MANAIDAVLRDVAAGDPLTCGNCERELVPGDAVTLDGSVYCPACGWVRATAVLEDFLHASYTPRELSARVYAEAWAVMVMLSKRIQERGQKIFCNTLFVTLTEKAGAAP
jgi:hypothetical protein